MEHQEKKIKLKLRFKIIIAVIIFILYIFFIGTKGIFIKDFVIESSSIDKNISGTKILQFSDLHYGSGIGKNEVKTLVNKINMTNPDIVIFTGDLIDKNYDITDEEMTFLKKQLSKIKYEQGKYYVTGEEDFEDSITILNSSDFINLANGHEILYFKNSSILLIDKENAKKYFENNEVDQNYKIFITHNPDDFDDVKKYNFNLALAGHTHNGQINIPKIKELFIESKYTKTYQKIDNTKLFINQGIGNKNIKARLFNHPTIYLYRLKNA